MDKNIEKYGNLIADYTKKNYRECFREPSGIMKYKFIVPGSKYSDDLWDWDSWLTDLALGEFVTDDISEYEKGCVLNFLDYVEEDGTTPIWITPDGVSRDFVGGKKTNIHKPNLAQHALYVSDKYGFEWLSGKFDAFERYDDITILRVKREEEFAPVKNATGVDSPETARELYKNFHNA